MGTAQQLLIVGGGSVVPFSSVVLLCHMDNLGSTTFIDSSSYAHNVSPEISQVAQSATQVKFGAASMPQAGTAGGLIVGQSSGGTEFEMRTGDFTIEGWFYPSSVTGTFVLLDFRHTNYDDGVHSVLYITTGGDLHYYTPSTDKIVATTAMVANAWQHVAYSRVGTSGKLFVDGTQVGSTYTDSLDYAPVTSHETEIFIGRSAFASSKFEGYIDEVRVTKGYGRYASNFTAPTAAFPNS